jgi:hypothetical protein
MTAENKLLFYKWIKLESPYQATWEVLTRNNGLVHLTDSTTHRYLNGLNDKEKGVIRAYYRKWYPWMKPNITEE